MTEAGQMDQMESRLPAHQVAYARLRDMVLFGELPPGAAVTIEGLVARLSLGMTPVREAIRRLIAEGALQLLGNRRVCVPRLTPDALDDLGFARRMVETRLALRALAARDPDLVALLRARDAQVDAAIAAGDIPGYLRHNHGFHFTLYARAGSEVLEGLAASLWLRIGPSLRAAWQAPGDGTGAARQPDHHKRAIAALESCDAAALEAAIAADIAQGVANIRATLARSAQDAPAGI